MYSEANKADGIEKENKVPAGSLFKVDKNSKKIYKTKNEFKCETCNKILKTDKGYQYHIYRHENPFLCYRCNQGFIDKHDLQKHFVRVHKEKYEPSDSEIRLDQDQLIKLVRLKSKLELE